MVVGFLTSKNCALCELTMDNINGKTRSSCLLSPVVGDVLFDTDSQRFERAGANDDLCTVLAEDGELFGVTTIDADLSAVLTDVGSADRVPDFLPGTASAVSGYREGKGAIRQLRL